VADGSGCQEGDREASPQQLVGGGPGSRQLQWSRKPPDEKHQLTCGARGQR